MSTIVVRVDVTWTTTSAGGVTKTTLPPAASDASGTARTIGSTDKGIADAAEEFRKRLVKNFLAVDPNANADCVITTQTTT